MKLIETPTDLKKIWQERESGFVDLLKIVIDIDRKIIAADAELHADLEELLLSEGSLQENLWGANLYPEKSGDDLIEYTAFINIRPSQDNRSMEIEDEDIRLQMQSIIKKLLKV